MIHYIRLIFLVSVLGTTGRQLVEVDRLSETEIKDLNDRAFRMLSVDRRVADSLSYVALLGNSNRFLKEEVRTALIRGMVMKYADKKDSAMRLFKMALVNAVELGLKKEEGLANWYIGKVWHEYQNYEEAKPYYKIAASILEEIGDSATRFKVLNGLGFMEKSQGNYIKALAYLNEALEVVYHSNLEDHANKLLSNISEVYYELNDLGRALHYNSEALIIKDSSANKGLIVEAMVQRAKIFSEMYHEDSVEVIFQRAYKYLKQYELDAGFLHYHLGVYYHNEKKYNASNEHFLAFLENPGGSTKTGHVYLYLSDNYRLLNHQSEAIRYAKYGYDIGVSSRLNEIKGKSADRLASLYTHAKDYQSANKYLGISNDCRDALFQSATTAEVANLQVAIQSHEKNKEIASLKSSIEAENFKRVLTLKLTSITIVVLVVAIFLLIRKYIKESQLFEIKESDLKNKYEQSKKELHTQTMHLIRVNNSVSEIEEKLRELKPKVNGHSLEVQRLINTIKLKKSEEKDWDNFDRYFNNSETGFINVLKQRFPALTLNELRLCTLIRENMTNSEIASILNVEKRSVAMAKFRCKKKCQIPADEDFTKFICSIDSSDSFKNAS